MQHSNAQDKKAVQDLIKRVLPHHYAQIEVHYSEKQNGKDWNEIESKSGKIILRGNNNVSIAVALNRYLRNYNNASVSWTSGQQPLTKTLKPIAEKTTKESPYDHRLYLNYCTFSYTMSFWDWDRWEKEIDWMALHGINLPLAMVGQEAVWQNTLKKFGYTNVEITDFIAGSAFTAWWLMGNLEGWGGPVSQNWIDQQAQLQQKIVGRMRALGMNPVLQGFYGMVPNSLIKKNPDAKIHDPGLWLNFKRPAMLMPTDPLFAKLSKVYYQEQEKLYGKTNFYQGDPFHEGGTSAGVNLAKAGQAIFKSMVDFNPDAIWVLQAWQDNPKAELLRNVPIGKVLITDLNAEARPQWGGRTKHLWNRKGGFGGHQWIWSMIPNFGGRTGMIGKLDSINIDVNFAVNHPIGRASMKGIGAAPESIGQDEILYDLLFDTAWEKDKIDLESWLKTYVSSRYGHENITMNKVWDTLRKTVYNSTYGQKDPPIESIFCARPAWNKKGSSTWGEWRIDYNPQELVAAWELSIEAIPQLGTSAAFQYDMVNLTRQVFANYGRSLYLETQKAYEAKDIPLYHKKADEFLELIKNQDKLLSSRKEFMLGPWLDMAKRKGTTPEEKRLNEFNARTLITTWTYQLNDVNDYSCREWSGLLKDYYLVRWETFFDNNLQNLKGETVAKPDFFAFEKKWTKLNTSYPLVPTEQPLEIVKTLYQKYITLIKD